MEWTEWIKKIMTVAKLEARACPAIKKLLSALDTEGGCQFEEGT